MRNILIFAAVLSGCTPAALPQLPDGKNRVVDIVNTASAPLQFMAVNAERRGLNRQPAASGEVAANYYQTFNFDDGSGACLFDFYAEFANGQGAETKRYNVCDEVSWVVTP